MGHQGYVKYLKKKRKKKGKYTFGQVSFLFHEVSIVIPSFILIFVNIFTIAKYVKYSKMKKKEKKKGKCIFGQVSILFHVASIVIPSFMFVISNFFTIAKTTLRAVYSKVEPNLAGMALRKREIQIHIKDSIMY